MPVITAITSLLRRHGPRPGPSRRYLLQLSGLLLFLLLGDTVTAQVAIARYYINSHAPTQNSLGELAVLIQEITSNGPRGTGLVNAVFYPQYGFSAVVADLTPAQRDTLIRLQYDVHVDAKVHPNAGESWPLNQWSPLPAPATSPGPVGLPVVYVVDTGILAAHFDFTLSGRNSALQFEEGISFGYNHMASQPMNPYQDPHNHGTRVAGCLGGRSIGLLPALGGKARVKSISIYDYPLDAEVSTFASQAILGILYAVSDHQARKAQPYLRNHASVLLFAHSTQATYGRMAALDQAIEVAWKEGMHVVLSAGNDNAAAVLVSPAGAAWGFQSTTGWHQRFWDGLPVGPGTYFRAEKALLVVGASEQNGKFLIRWPQSNHNNLAEAIDFFAPGTGLSCPSGTNLLFYVNSAGTSMAAGYGAALVSWAAYRCPWARPAQIREAVLNSLRLQNGLPTVPSLKLPTSLPYTEWIQHYYPPGLTPDDARLLTADPDGDGVVNFVEYHCGQDPRYADAQFAPEIIPFPNTSSTLIKVRMPMANYLGPTPQVTWELQHSSDLRAWTPLTTTLSSSAPASLNNDAQLYEFIAQGPPLPTQTALRIKFSFHP